MQTVKITLVILICVVLLGACGLKGPLYLPAEESTVEQDILLDEDAKKEEEDETTQKNPSAPADQ
jgi:predicted small lipoprotein YifL